MENGGGVGYKKLKRLYMRYLFKKKKTIFFKPKFSCSNFILIGIFERFDSIIY